jgi:hypothetical protein
MELLDGGDLQQLAPLPWRTVCAIGRDIGSALSLLHSRRLVHRDVSPRNVRLTQAGPGKLIDFGAMSAFGPSKLIVGTPPCCAPESLRLQPLDGRTDLFSLGATLYYGLVGQHAYAATNLAELSETWQAGIVRPSLRVADVPAALDALLLDLLRLEPDARPPNAAEVIERLSAIDGERDTEPLRVAQAYLSMPPLVGRSQALGSVNRALKRIREGRASTLVVEGAPGVGRSRFLDTCLLDATLLGLATARADAQDATTGDYGMLRALARQLTIALPSLVAQTAQPHIALLARALPELLEVCDPPELAEPASLGALRAQLQAATIRWLEALSELTPLVLGVDDYHHADEPSAALLSLLAQEKLGRLCLLVSIEQGAPSTSHSAQALLLEAASVSRLANLNEGDSERLLHGVFGDAPGVRTFARRVSELAGGNPRALMQLAQHLIDRGVLRYEAGAWQTPAGIDQADLPATMADALRERTRSLTSSARELAHVLALCPDLSFDFAECASLSAVQDSAPLVRHVDELLRAEIARSIDGQIGLAKPLWIAPLRAASSAELERPLHARLARVLEARDLQFRAGQHWLRAHEHAHAIDVLVAHARTSQSETAKSSEHFMRYARSLPADWYDTYLVALRLCDELARPKRDAFFLRARLAGIVPAFGTPDPIQVPTLLAQLAEIVGLDELAAIDPALGPVARAQLALAQASARQAALPDHERTLEPAAALAVLARAASAYLSRVPVGLDPDALAALPDLSPYAAISPAIALIDKLVAGLRARYSGQTERARAIYREVLQRLHQPDRGGLDASYATITQSSVMHALGAMDACLGSGSSVTFPTQPDDAATRTVPLMRVHMLQQLYLGDIRGAEECKHRVELLRLQSQQLYESPPLIWEIGAYTIAEDLTRVRHVIEQLAPLAARYPGWRALHHYASAEYQRIRRDPARALVAIQDALTLATPTNHPLWASMATTHVLLLLDLARDAEALALASRYLHAADRADITPGAETIRMSLALCQARSGEAAALAAEATADSVIEHLGALGVHGLLLGLAHETRARVALARKDVSGFTRHADHAHAAYGCESNPALLAKHRRLVQENDSKAGANGCDPALPAGYVREDGVGIVEALAFCKGMEQRGRLALTILARHAGASGGFLFAFEGDVLAHVASVGADALPEGLHEHAREHVARHATERVTTATDTQDADDDVDVAPSSGEWRDQASRPYRAVLLSHRQPSGLAIVGVVMLGVDQRPIVYPAKLAEAISRFWASTGGSSVLALPSA